MTHIREAVIEDAQELRELHRRAVMALCREAYTQEQLDGWVGAVSLARYRQRIEDHRSWVALNGTRIVGYVRWNPKTNELCSIFVDPDSARHGIATKLMHVAVEDAGSRGVEDMWLDASLNAVPFYEALGWEKGESGMHGQLECVRMRFRIG